MIFQFYSLSQQAAADSWKNRLVLGSEFSDIVPGVFTLVVAKYSHTNRCHLRVLIRWSNPAASTHFAG